MRKFLGMYSSEKYLCQLVLTVDLIIFIPTEEPTQTQLHKSINTLGKYDYNIQNRLT